MPFQTRSPFLFHQSFAIFSFQHSFPPQFNFFFAVLKDITPPLSIINNTTTEQRGLRYKKSAMLFTLHEKRSIQFQIAGSFVESEKTLRHIHSTTLLRDDCRDLLTMDHSAIECAYAEILILYFFSGDEDSPLLLANWSPPMSITGQSKTSPKGCRVGCTEPGKPHHRGRCWT